MMVHYKNILIATSLLNAGKAALKAEKSKRLYGKVKDGKKWIYWTKVEPSSLPESYAKHFK